MKRFKSVLLTALAFALISILPAESEAMCYENCDNTVMNCTRYGGSFNVYDYYWDWSSWQRCFKYECDFSGNRISGTCY